MESIVNILAAFMGLYSLYLSGKPQDNEHPYGHGKVEFLTSGIEGALIVLAGIMICIQAIGSLLRPEPIKSADIGLVIIFFAGLVNYILGMISIRKGKKSNSAVLVSSGKHLQADTITTAGVVFSLIIIHFTGWVWVDAVMALLFGGYIMYSAYGILRNSVKGIMDEADVSIVKELAKSMEEIRQDNWIDIHDLRVQQHGADLHIDAHVTLPYYYTLKQAHAELELLMQKTAKSIERKIEFNFHMDDCKPCSCAICTLEECPVRLESFKAKIPWTEATVTLPNKHRYSDIERIHLSSS